MAIGTNARHLDARQRDILCPRPVRPMTSISLSLNDLIKYVLMHGDAGKQEI